MNALRISVGLGLDRKERRQLDFRGGGVSLFDKGVVAAGKGVDEVPEGVDVIQHDISVYVGVLPYLEVLFLDRQFQSFAVSLDKKKDIVAICQPCIWEFPGIDITLFVALLVALGFLFFR